MIHSSNGVVLDNILERLIALTSQNPKLWTQEDIVPDTTVYRLSIGQYHFSVQTYQMENNTTSVALSIYDEKQVGRKFGHYSKVAIDNEKGRYKTQLNELIEWITSPIETHIYANFLSNAFEKLAADIPYGKSEIKSDLKREIAPPATPRIKVPPYIGP